MFELIADGPLPRQRWKLPLQPGRSYELGREGSADLPVTWDQFISRRHARLTPQHGFVLLERLPHAHNPIFYEGEPVEQPQEIRPGHHFVIGSTSFLILQVQQDPSYPSAQPVEEVAFDPQELRKVRFRDADKRIDVLAHLPEVIWGARTESEMYSRLVNLMLAGVAQADAVAVVRLDSRGELEVAHWDRRRETEGGFRPSSRLVREALRRRRRSILHVWKMKADNAVFDFTQPAEEFDWAYCTPVPQTSAEPWGLYVTGKMDRSFIGTPEMGGQTAHLQADVKFTELVAEIISSVQRLNKLERQQSGLRQFFAPPILAALGDDLDTELLEPRECDVTVLFCDLRGFSQQAEEAADDLLGLLDRVSRALGVMTQHILANGGVTGDFQGDAALGFWGWPFPSEEAPLNACRAALGIRAAFDETRGRKDHPLANFKMGIGIAHGRAVAGKIGTQDQVKITVFGPVVNLASRLEGMTKHLRVPILLDEATVNAVRPMLQPDIGRIRGLARIQPYGMETPLLVSELLPPEAAFPELSSEHVHAYEEAVQHFIAGRWEEANRSLYCLPPTDRAQDFLRMLIAQHNRVAPRDWDGVVRLASK